MSFYLLYIIDGNIQLTYILLMGIFLYFVLAIEVKKIIYHEYWCYKYDIVSLVEKYFVAFFLGQSLTFLTLWIDVFLSNTWIFSFSFFWFLCSHHFLHHLYRNPNINNFFFTLKHTISKSQSILILFSTILQILLLWHHLFPPIDINISSILHYLSK